MHIALKLFYNKLNYTVHPNYSKCNVNNYKAYWTQDEFMQFLRKIADDLERNVVQYDKHGTITHNEEGYDGLVMLISCHGIQDYIITSDYKKISKEAIHRTFSAKKPSCRKIPRIFIFDCCSGDQDRDADWRAVSPTSSEIGKNIDSEDVHVLEQGKR